jgi:3-oxoacyl-[acyl-carrier protein] reductase
MDLGLQNKVAVVLASTTGLGYAVAEALLDEGACVAISGRNPERLQDALQRLQSAQADRVVGEAFDVTDTTALESHLRHVKDRWGAVHILVTNAGGPPTGQAADITEPDLDRAYALTMKSAIHAVKTVLPWMRAQHWGRIIGMTSSSVRQPIANLALSNTMRAGLTGYFKTLSFEVAQGGILVNTICTGMFMTDRLTELFEIRAAKSGRTIAQEKQIAEQEIPLRRLGDPKEFGAMVAFMASERASFLNGTALPYDGGASRFLL